MSDTAALERPKYIRTELAVYRLCEFITVDAFAEMIGRTPQYLNAHKWLLPNWGASDLPSGERRWHLPTVRAWLDEMTPAQRQTAWDALPPSTKAALKRKQGVR